MDLAPVFDQKALSQRWLEGFRAGQEQFEVAVYAHFTEFVPLVYVNNLDGEKEERRARQFLFHPLEEFMCQAEPADVFRELGQTENPSQLCGHNFKNGEPTYSCRDCAYDPTCVLCITCFQKSSHRNHRYRMSTSGGGGYCDCGDLEAWKTDPFCVLHRPYNDDDRSGEMSLPGEMPEFVSRTFRCVLQFASALLTLEDSTTLPLDMPLREDATNPFMCMLYNDEVHTYDQVINTLQRAVSCTQRQALEYATVVDREGRSCVKIATEEECNVVKQTIERSTARGGTKPLKVDVVRKHVVALQQFALRILAWLMKVSDKASCIRRILCQTLMEPGGSVDNVVSVLETFIQADTRLWKVARVQSHQLLMSCVLKDPPSKKQFSVIFTKWFPYMVKAFSEDDHDHDVSMPSLSVQIFTVPSLARMLIAEHDLLTVIVKAFLAACDVKKNPTTGKLNFDRQDRNTSFKRSMYVLHDLKYALVCRPTCTEDWSEALRNNFLRGLTKFLELLSLIQGMDSVKRQTGQHLEFDPEWEGAFTIQIKLEDLLVLFTDWCSADRYLLVEGYKATLEALSTQTDVTPIYEDMTVAGHTGKVFKYDVSTEPISIHYPLNRFLVALHVHLETYGLTFTSPELQNPHLPEMAAAVQLPESRTETLQIHELMEPALRIQVLLAQCQAGMWRRNGYSLQNQVFFYSNLRCRQEMYDRDIIMLQMAASQLPGNDFILQMLNKFNLLNWVKMEYDTPGTTEDSVRQTVTLAEEFLTLLIVVIEERFVPGVGQVTKTDQTKREVVHLLCQAPMAHSKLTKALNEDINHETGLDQVVNEIATFKKPASGGNGKFELNPQHYKDYSPYFYHYYKAEQAKSEEVQRQRKKQAEEDQSLPPPNPPPFSPQFRSCMCVMDCDLMIHLLTLVLQRTAAPRSRSWSEAQFDRVLFLIGLALHEQIAAFERGDKSYTFLAKAMVRGATVDDQEGSSILSLLQSLVHNPNLSTQESKDLLAWVLRRFAEALQALDEPVAKEHVDSIARCTDLRSDQDRKKRAQVAAKRRAKVMARMAAQQKDFIAENAELFENTSIDGKQAEGPTGMEICDLPPIGDETLVALGPTQSSFKVTGAQTVTCILCQEEQRLSHTGRAMVLSAFVQQSTVLAQHNRTHHTGEDGLDPLFSPSDLSNGTHTSSCGHVMHHECWQRFFTNIVNRERRRPLRFRHSFSYDIDKMEYLCPLCEGLSNTVIPLVPALHTLTGEHRDQKTLDLTFDDWLDGIQKTVVNSIKEGAGQEGGVAPGSPAHEPEAPPPPEARSSPPRDDPLLFQPCPLSTISRLMAESVAKNFKQLWDFVLDTPSTGFSEGLSEMIKKFARDVYTFGLGVEPDDENNRVPVMAWNTCAYTIQALEQELSREKLAVFESLPERQNALLAALVRVAAVTSQVMNPELIKQHCVRLLSALIPAELESRNLHPPKCLLDLDPLHYLVVLTCTLPSLHAEGGTSSLASLPVGGINDQHALQLVFTAHLVHILLSYDAPCMEVEEEEPVTQEERDLLEVYRSLRAEARVVDSALPPPSTLMQNVKTACLPFLRCCALLYNHLTGVVPPPQLTSVNILEFSHLCRYLALPSNVVDLFGQPGSTSHTLIHSWCSSRSVQERLSASSQPLTHYPLRLNTLIFLPQDYSLLINEASTFTCPKSQGDDSRAPTRCLVCGRMLCSQSYCCQTELEGSQVGAATEHAYYCGANAGLFLRVRECQVLLLSNKMRGCFLPAPYLDCYGETDQNLRRGNPLTLSVENYASIEKLWFQHNIPQTISRSLNGEPSANLLIEWHNL